MKSSAATWIKLYDDSWGVKLYFNYAQEGDYVTVARRDGSTSDVRLQECVADGAGWMLWRVQQFEAAQESRPTSEWRPFVRRRRE